SMLKKHINKERGRQKKINPVELLSILFELFKIKYSKPKPIS
ncbi:MAG: hypothetical protein ACI9U0_000785, partial [Flavobacteriales bacterium]